MFKSLSFRLDDFIVIYYDYEALLFSIRSKTTVHVNINLHQISICLHIINTIYYIFLRMIKFIAYVKLWPPHIILFSFFFLIFKKNSLLALLYTPEDVSSEVSTFPPYWFSKRRIYFLHSHLKFRPSWWHHPTPGDHGL